MLLIDFSQIVYQDFLMQLYTTGKDGDKKAIRNFVTERIIKFKNQFNVENRDVVVCIDSKNYWRKDLFPFYKQNRTKQAGIDTELYFNHVGEVLKEMKQDLPFTFLKIDRCEADDIIAVLCYRLNGLHDLTIISTDHDYLQLQTHCKVKQYDQVRKKYITIDSEKYCLFSHIVRAGDDGIPNILSDADTFVNPEKRQTQLREKILTEWKKHGINAPEKYCDNKMYERFKQNQSLIDMTMIPDAICNQIYNAYLEYDYSKGTVYKFCVKHGITNVLKGMRI